MPAALTAGVGTAAQATLVLVVLLSLSPEDDAFFADAAETEARGHQSEEERAGVCVARIVPDDTPVTGPMRIVRSHAS